MWSLAFEASARGLGVPALRPRSGVVVEHEAALGAGTLLDPSQVSETKLSSDPRRQHGGWLGWQLAPFESDSSPSRFGDQLRKARGRLCQRVEVAHW